MRDFLDVIDSLGDRLGPILFQFPYGFKPDRLGDLITFLDALPREERYRYVVEIRNRAWLRSKLPDMLEERALPLCLVDHPWMPRESRVTGPFVYLRFLGDQEAITEFGQTQIDRTAICGCGRNRAQQWLEAGLPVYAFFNNHFSGFAPHDARVFAELLEETAPAPEPPHESAAQNRAAAQAQAAHSAAAETAQGGRAAGRVQAPAETQEACNDSLPNKEAYSGMHRRFAF